MIHILNLFIVLEVKELRFFQKRSQEKTRCINRVGNGFIDTDYNEVIVVGGGSGTPPMYGLAKKTY